MTTSIPDTILQPAEIPSQGNSTGESTGALTCSAALVLFGNLINQINATAADLGVYLANIATEISKEQQQKTQEYYDNNIAPIVNRIPQESGDTLQKDEAAMQTYNTQLGMLQTQYQSANKSIEPSTTSVQNLGSQVTQMLNAVIASTAEAIKILSFSAQCRIT